MNFKFKNWTNFSLQYCNKFIQYYICQHLTHATVPTKLKIWGIFSILIIKLEVNTYLLLENFTEYNDLDYFQTKKNHTLQGIFLWKCQSCFKFVVFVKKSTLLSRYPHRNPVTPGMFNDSLSRTRHIKFSRMSKFYKLENQHAITILQKEDRYITINN